MSDAFGCTRYHRGDGGLGGAPANGGSGHGVAGFAQPGAAAQGVLRLPRHRGAYPLVLHPQRAGRPPAGRDGPDAAAARAPAARQRPQPARLHHRGDHHGPGEPPRRLGGWRRHYAGRAVPNRGRDPQLYYLTVFCDPDAGAAANGDAAWGWRAGGHHLSVSYTLVGNQVAASPLFFGANPASTALVGPGLLRPLAGEEDLARELLAALSPQERAAALLSEVAPDDILQFNRPMVRDLGHPVGLAAGELTTAQQKLLAALVRQYLDRLPDEVASAYAERLSLSKQGAAFAAIHFAWAGGSTPGQGHYYRLQGPRLLIEYDCTQNHANHIHAVLRDPDGDFGADLLA